MRMGRRLEATLGRWEKESTDAVIATTRRVADPRERLVRLGEEAFRDDAGDEASDRAHLERAGMEAQLLAGVLLAGLVDLRELGAGLIVTGGQKRPWFVRLFGPDFSTGLFRKADRPVLVIGKHTLQNLAVPK